MKYLSLFSGIGSFELAIHKVFPDAECIGYSEIEKNALAIYKHHFPEHLNLGDITKLTEKKIKNIMKDGCDLVVGGFPCKNLTSLAVLNRHGDSSGLEGSQSKLFYELVRIMKIITNEYQMVDFVFENNASMKKSNKNLITQSIQNLTPKKIYITRIDAALFGVQTRNRLFWTTFPVNIQNVKCEQTWKDVLDTVEMTKKLAVSDGMVLCMNKKYRTKRERICKTAVKIGDFFTFALEKAQTRSRWDMGFISDTMDTQIYIPYPLGKSRPILTYSGSNNLIIDRRHGNNGNNDMNFIVRRMTENEMERLFGYDDNYTGLICRSKRITVLGNSISVFVTTHIMEYFLEYLIESKFKNLNHHK